MHGNIYTINSVKSNMDHKIVILIVERRGRGVDHPHMIYEL